jgi:hypothetical protein
MEYVSLNRKNSDLIYLYYGTRPAFAYYASFYGFKDGDYRVGVSARSNSDKYLKDIDTLRGRGRVWFVFSHVYNWNKIDEVLYYNTYLNGIGKKIDEFTAPGAAVYLYDLKGSSSRKEK